MTTVDQHTQQPCLNCGACCAAFRVSFYWAEASEQGLPDGSYQQVSAFLAAMKGTNSPSPRCCALIGDIGQDTTCSVYDSRPSPCREVQPGDEKCQKARLLSRLHEL
jgi:uncharacterized protein